MINSGTKSAAEVARLFRIHRSSVSRMLSKSRVVAQVRAAGIVITLSLSHFQGQASLSVLLTAPFSQRSSVVGGACDIGDACHE
jgi:hypothetical protein